MKNHISSDIHVLRAKIRKDPYFEGFWEMEHGVTVNCYLIKAEKTVLVDLFCEWDDSIEEIENQLGECGVSVEDIDVLILHHMENDHTGHLLEYMKRNKKMQIYASSKAVDMLKKYIKVSEADWERLNSVKTGDSLDIGKGKESGESLSLDFYSTPNVHWPETMMSFEKTTGTLFSCDGFGSYGIEDDHCFSDEISEERLAFFEKETLYYYANIVSSFSRHVLSAIKTLSDLPINVIAPSHGLVWRGNIQHIIDMYARLAGYNAGGELEKRVCIVCGSMYGNTERGALRVKEVLESKGVECVFLPIPETPLSRVVGECFAAKALVLAFPTYEMKMYPPAVWVLDMFNRKHMKDKVALRIGSWAWSGGAEREYEELTSKLNWEELDSVEWRGCVDKSTLSVLDEATLALADMLT